MPRSIQWDSDLVRIQPKGQRCPSSSLAIQVRIASHASCRGLRSPQNIGPIAVCAACICRHRSAAAPIDRDPDQDPRAHQLVHRRGRPNGCRRSRYARLAPVGPSPGVGTSGEAEERIGGSHGLQIATHPPARKARAAPITSRWRKGPRRRFWTQGPGSPAPAGTALRRRGVAADGHRRGGLLRSASRSRPRSRPAVSGKPRRRRHPARQPAAGSPDARSATLERVLGPRHHHPGVHDLLPTIGNPEDLLRCGRPVPVVPGRRCQLRLRFRGWSR